MSDEKNDISQIGTVVQDEYVRPISGGIPVLAQYEDEPQSPYELSWRTIAAVLALSMGNVCAALTNTTNTTVHFQVISTARSASDSALASWIANANFIVVLAMGPIFGSLSDRLGKKWFMVGGALLGIIGTCISGSAKTTSQIVGGQILTGFAVAGCIVSVSAIQEILPNKLRPFGMGVAQTMASAFVVLGTFMAGAMVRYNTGGNGGWRWAYYFSAIIFAVTALSIAFTYFPPKPLLGRHRHWVDIFSKVDYIGIVVMSGSFAALTIGVTWGGSLYPWSSPKVIVSLVIGSVGLVAFGLYEAFVVKEGILDHRMFLTFNFPILLFVCGIDGMLLLGVNVLYAQEIAALFTQDAVRIAVILCPYLITSTFGCLPAGWIMAATKSYRAVLVVALVICALFTGLMALINADRLNWTFAFTAIFGLGTAVTTTIPTNSALFTALGLSIPSYLIGTAATVSISVRALGGIIGITLFTAIYNNTYMAAVGPEVYQDGPVDLVASASAWRWVWVAVACLVTINAIAACFLTSVAPMMTQHIESALEEGKTRDTQMAEGL